MRRLFFLLPLVSSGLLWLSFHPADVGVLAWISLVPLLVYALREPKGWRVFLVSWLAGWAFFSGAFYWMGIPTPLAPYLLGIYKGFYVALFAYFVRVLSRRMPLALSAPVAWIALEYARSHLLTGLPWFLMAYTQHEFLKLIQVSDLLGPWLVSGIVVLTNAAVTRGILARLEGKVVMLDSHFRGSIAAAAILLTLAWLYGTQRLGIELEDGPRIALIQPNVKQEAKLLMRSDREVQEIFDTHVKLTQQVRQTPAKRDLILWPESVIYHGLRYDPESGRYEGALIDEETLLEKMMKLSKESDAPILFGSEVAHYAPKSPEAYEGYEFTNSAVVVDGDRGVTYRYDKNHLVLFSEKVPRLPLVKFFSEKYTGHRDLLSFRSGARFNQFEAGGKRIGTIICFENVFPEISREYARNGAQVLVNISNEGWFKGSAELDQMLVMSRFRAVENRIAIVRCTNTGVSAVIEPTGRVPDIIGGKEVPGTLDATVRISRSGSLYRSVGDVLAWLTCAFAAGGLAWAASCRVLTARKGGDKVAP